MNAGRSMTSGGKRNASSETGRYTKVCVRVSPTDVGAASASHRAMSGVIVW